MNSDTRPPQLGQPPTSYDRAFYEKIMAELRSTFSTLTSPGPVRASSLSLSQIPTSNSGLRDGDTWADNSFVRIYSGAAQDTLSETIADTVGAMVTGNTETGISVTYDDADNTIDFVVDTEFIADTVGAMFSGNTETGIAVTYQDADNTIDLALDDEYLQDIVGAMVTGNTETNIAVTYDDTTGKLNFVVATEDIQDIAGAMVTGGTETGISVTYDDTNARFDFVVDAEFIADTAGAMVSGNTETGITVTYQDTDNTIDFAIAYATQANMEADSSSDVAVKPSVMRYSPGVAKGWITCLTDGTISASYNVTSIADTGTGQVTITWAEDFSAASHSLTATVRSGGARFATIGTQAAGTCRIDCYSNAGALTDPVAYCVTAHGDV